MAGPSPNKCVCREGYEEIGAPFCSDCYYSCYYCENSYDPANDTT